MDLTICVATAGDEWWRKLAKSRAIPSAKAQGVPVVTTHYRSGVTDARNAAARKVQTEWMMFLDADDELAPGYVEAIGRATGDLRVGALTYLYPDGRRESIDLSRRNMERSNRCHIGTAIRTETFWSCGGFPGFVRWDDWAIFLRAYRRGARIEHVADAEYLAHVRPDSLMRTVHKVANPRELNRKIYRWA